MGTEENRTKRNSFSHHVCTERKVDEYSLCSLGPQINGRSFGRRPERSVEEEIEQLWIRIAGVLLFAAAGRRIRGENSLDLLEVSGAPRSVNFFDQLIGPW